MSAHRPTVEELQRQLAEKEADLIDLQLSMEAMKEFFNEPTTVNWRQI